MNDMYFYKQNGCGMGVVCYCGCDMWVWQVGARIQLEKVGAYVVQKLKKKNT